MEVVHPQSHVVEQPKNKISEMHFDDSLLAHTGIQIHHSKTQLWNRAGVAPVGSVALTAAVQVLDPDAIVWRGDAELNIEDQGLVILGTPLGHEDFVRSKKVRQT